MAVDVGVVNVSARSLRIKANMTLFHSMKWATCFYNISLNFLPYLFLAIFMPRAVSRMSQIRKNKVK